MLNTASVNNFLLRKVAFYKLKPCHIQQGLYQELQNFPSTSFLSAYSYTLRPIHVHNSTKYWFIYMFGSLLPSNFGEANCYLYWTTICRNHSKKLISM